MTVDEIIDGLLEREGPGNPLTGYRSPGDAGGRTHWGISERAHPEAWLDGPPTMEAARAIYRAQYVQPFLVVADERLREALVDDAVLSGVQTAVRRLQAVLGVAIDGVLGVRTLEAIAARPRGAVLQGYVVERAVRLVRLAQRRPADLVNLGGWIKRVLGFLPPAAD